VNALENSITLDEIFAVVIGKRVALAPEIAGYLALEVAQGARTAEGEVEPRAVYISEEGTVALVRPKKDTPTGDAETSVRAILGRLLETSGSATPSLSAIAKRTPGSGLLALIHEIEASLVPINRAAGRRALARLAHDVKRITMGVGRNASLSSYRPSAARTVFDSTPAPLAVALRAEGPSAAAAVVATRSTTPTINTSANTSEVKPPALPASGAREKVSAEPSRTMATWRDPNRLAATPGMHRPRMPRTSLAILAGALFVCMAGIVALWMVYPSFFTGKNEPAVALSPEGTLATSTTAPRCKVTLVVTDVPASAEILLRMGQPPLDIERMPMGTRLEFVATAEGYAPKRAIVKSESLWNKGMNGKPSLDLPIELESLPNKLDDKPGGTANAAGPWPLAEPGTEVGGSGPPGTVHVAANVRGAEVWLLAGIGPEARIEQLRCDADIDVLLAGPEALRKRLHVNKTDIVSAPSTSLGNKVVTVTGSAAQK
jgi:hypothetical protein